MWRDGPRAVSPASSAALENDVPPRWPESAKRTNDEHAFAHDPARDGRDTAQHRRGAPWDSLDGPADWRRVRGTAASRRTEIVALEGNGRLERVMWPDGTGAVSSHEIRHVFMMTGAEANTGWLNRRVTLDEKNFIKTGADLTQKDLEAARWPLGPTTAPARDLASRRLRCRRCDAATSNAWHRRWEKARSLFRLSVTCWWSRSKAHPATSQPPRDSLRAWARDRHTERHPPFAICHSGCAFQPSCQGWQSQASARARRNALSRALRVSVAAAVNSERASASRPARNRKSPLAAGNGA